jgi:hypothetical protein
MPGQWKNTDFMDGHYLGVAEQSLIQGNLHFFNAGSAENRIFVGLKYKKQLL